MRHKYLIVRFSSFGDIMQCLPAAGLLKLCDRDSTVHFLTRSDFADVVAAYEAAGPGISFHKPIDRVWSLNRRLGFWGLLRLANQLRREHYTHVYDAHSNLRSFIVVSLLRITAWPRIIRRSKNRFKRFLLFRFRINRFARPFCGADSYTNPLSSWLNNQNTPAIDCRFDFQNVNLPSLENGEWSEQIAVVPAAAWPLKEWPLVHWQTLIRNKIQSPTVLLGGVADAAAYATLTGKKNQSLFGQLTWLQSLKAISLSVAVIGGDTGLLHAADLIKKPAIMLIGPTAFGFPKNGSTKVLDVELPCRPCTKDGRGRCRITETKACLTRVQPDTVSTTLTQILSSFRKSPNAAV